MSGNRNRPWRALVRRDLRRMWRSGMSARQIAEALNERHGLTLTRNAVIGKLWRMAHAPRGPAEHASPAPAAGGSRLPPATAPARAAPGAGEGDAAGARAGAEAIRAHAGIQPRRRHRHHAAQTRHVPLGGW